MILYRLALLLIAAAALSCPPAHAQGTPWPSDAFNAPKLTNVPGQFDYYTLVLSWSPTHCVTTERGTDDSQCARDDGLRFGFLLHGLWPQHEKGYPGRCHTRWRPFVPEAVIGEVFDVMPSRRLVIHEYRQHGTCSGLRPAPYFRLARRLFNGIRIPKRYHNPFETQLLSPREVLRDFLRANPELRPDMVAVTCGGAGNRLRDVRICFTKNGRLRSCGLNERGGTACRARHLRVPPVRSTRRWTNKRIKPPPKGESFTLPIPKVGKRAH